MKTLASIILTGIAVFLLAACSSLSIKDRETLKIASAAARSGNDKAFIAMNKALELPEPEGAPDIHRQILAELANLPSEQSLDILRKYMQDRIPGRREQAVLSFSRNRTLSTVERGDELYTTISSNKKNYVDLTAGEIQALAVVDKEGSLEILKKEFYSSTDSKPQIIQSTGLILSRNIENSVLAAAAIKNLREFITETDDAAIVNLAVQTLRASAGSEGAQLVQSITLTKEEAPELRMRVLNVLGSELIRSRDQQYADKLKTAWKTFQKEPAYARRIAEILAEYEGKSLAVMISILRRGLPARVPPLRREYLQMGTPEGIFSLAESHGVSRNTLSKMSSRISDIMQDERTPVKPEKRVISSALNLVAPSSNYFEKRKMASRGISQRGVFSSVLRVVTRSGRPVAWQVMVIRNIAGVSQSEAAKLRTFYYSERTTLDRL